MMLRTFAWLGLVAACHEAEPTRVALSKVDPAPSASTSTAAPPITLLDDVRADAPLVVGATLVSPIDGRVVGKVNGVDAYAIAIHAGAHRYRVNDVIVDTRTGAQARAWPPAALLGAANDSNGSIVSVTRYELDGKVRWKTPVTGTRSVRPPDVVASANRVVGSIGSELYGFDDARGALVWHVPGPSDRIATDGVLAYSTDCSVQNPARALVARNLSDGKEVWRAKLPVELDPWISVDASHVVVVDERNVSIVFDHAGKKLFEAREALLGDHVHGFSIHPLGRDMLVASNHRTARIDETGHAIWERPALPETFVAGTDFVDLPGGDVLVASYGAISDSGVHLFRLNAATGAVVWEANARSLGVAHSEYMHSAYIEVRGASLFVVSQASGGSFFERVALATGTRELRCVVASSAAFTCAKSPP